MPSALSTARNIEAIRLKLERLDSERKVLERLLSDYESLALVQSVSGKRVGEKANAPRGKVSIRSAILTVLEGSNRPMTAKEIWTEIEKMGARTDSKHPPSIVDLIAYQLQQSGRPLYKEKDETGKPVWHLEPQPVA